MFSIQNSYDISQDRYIGFSFWFVGVFLFGFFFTFFFSVNKGRYFPLEVSEQLKSFELSVFKACNRISKNIQI